MRIGSASLGSAPPETRRRAGSLLLRPTRRRLLPIGQRVAGRLGEAPAFARCRQRRLVATVEEVEATAVLGEGGRGPAAGHPQHVGPGWVSSPGGPPNPLP